MEEFTIKAKKALEWAGETAKELGHGYIGSEHILCGLLREGSGLAAKVLLGANVNENSVISMIDRFISQNVEIKRNKYGYTPSAERILEQSGREAIRFRANSIGTEHILIAILKDNDSIAARMLNTMGVNIQKLYNEILKAIGEDLPEYRDEFNKTYREKSKVETPTLDQYSKDLTEMAAERMLDPIIGREKEIMRVVQILSRRTKNNPCLIGEPGVGKTAVVEGLAQMITEGNVPDSIAGKRLLSLDLSGMVAGSKYRGEFEERIKRVIAEAKADGDVLLFIDEIHTIIGAGGAEGALDAANILKPSLARGELQIIGATTIDEYRKHIEKDTALERRFQPVNVDEPNEKEAIDILMGIRHKYEEHHGVEIADDAVYAAVKLSERYINDRYLPDKAIDIIDEAASRLKITSFKEPSELHKLEEKIYKIKSDKEAAIIKEEYEEASRLKKSQERAEKKLEKQRTLWEEEKHSIKLIVGEKEVAGIVSDWTKVPVQKLTEAEADNIRNLESVLHERIISQDEAVSAVARAIRRGRVGIKDPGRPIGSFLFLGPTGVGKTELSKSVAEAVFGSEQALIRVDMSEYMEKHSVSKMIGSPPGYVGFDEGGQLAEKVRRNPYSVILFDEIEKAHPDVFNVLLQVLDDGHITDAQGRKIDFKNTVIIMTSNAGAMSIVAPKKMGFASAEDRGRDYQDMKDKVMEDVKQIFKPEFLNRVDELIVFHQLSRDDMDKIVDIMVNNIKKRTSEHLKLELEISSQAKQRIIENGYDEKYGARPLRRAIQTMVEDEIAESVLCGNISYGDTVSIDIDPDNSKKLVCTRKTSKTKSGRK